MACVLLVDLIVVSGTGLSCSICLIESRLMIGVARLTNNLILKHDAVPSLALVHQFLHGEHLVVHFVVVQLVDFFC